MTNFLGFDYVTPLTIASNQPELTTDTLSLRRIVGRTEAQRWEMQVTLEPDSFGSNGLLNTVQVHREVNGGHTAFTLPIPQLLNTSATSQADVAFSAPVLAGETEILITSTDPFVIPAGLFITIAGNSKVHRVTQTAASATAGSAPFTATLNVFPSLTADRVVGALVTVSDVMLTARHNTDNGGIVGYTLSQGVVDRLTLSVTEAL